jgi:hypothetical protein
MLRPRPAPGTHWLDRHEREREEMDREMEQRICAPERNDAMDSKPAGRA